MKDKYDKAVKHLTKNPGEIYYSWCRAECLFGFVGKKGWTQGCLTQIKNKVVNRYAVKSNGEIDFEFTKAIRDDERIPSNEMNITVSNLPVFAEWRRIIDIWKDGGDWKSKLKKVK